MQATPYTNAVKNKMCLAAESIHGCKYTGTHDSHSTTCIFDSNGLVNTIVENEARQPDTIGLEGKYNYTHATSHLVGNLLYRTPFSLTCRNNWDRVFKYLWKP